MQNSIDWEKVRSNYQLPQQRVYLNNPSFGAMSDRTVAIQKDCLDQWQSKGNHLNERSYEAADHIRRMILKMTNGNNHEVGVISDVSTAMNQLAEVLRNKKKIALLHADYPATSAPWLVRGFDITWIKRKGLNHEIADIEQALIDGCDVVVLSWVMYNSGVILDIKSIGRLCRQYGAVFIVDATQGLLAHPLDLEDIQVDVVLASAFKWMLAGYGIALIIADKDFTSNYEITIAGQNSIIDGEIGADIIQNYRQGIERLEVGHAKIQQTLALENALIELNEIGLEAIHEKTAWIGKRIIDSLIDHDIEILTPEPMSNNVVMIESTPERLKKLQQANIDFTHRHGLIRFGAYFYNNEADVSRLIQALN